MKALFFIVILLLPLCSYSDSLSLHIIKSPLGLSWRSPFALTTSALKNQIVPTRRKVRHKIGHVSVEINCDSTGEHIYRGMTSVTNSEERDLLFKKKYGMGVIYHTYAGRMEQNPDIMADLKDYEGSPRLAHLTFKIPAATCQRLLTYAHEYEERGYGKYYSGFLADPLKGEGAGCSAFVMSFIEVGGLFEPFMGKWKVNVNVPKKLVGGPLTGNKVSLFKILKNFRTPWSSEVPHIPTQAWEPQLMHEWTQWAYNEIKEGKFPSEYGAQIKKHKKTRTVVLDLSSRPTPTGAYWRD